MAMERPVRGAEDAAAIVNRQELADTTTHGAVPQFEVALVSFLPIFVEVENEIDAAVQLESAVVIKIGMDLQEAAGHDLVKPAPFKVRVRDQAVDSREHLQEIEKCGAVELVKDV